jgi:hypothetical protein
MLVVRLQFKMGTGWDWNGDDTCNAQAFVRYSQGFLTNYGIASAETCMDTSLNKSSKGTSPQTLQRMQKV